MDLFERGGLQELKIFFFIDIQISGNSDLPVYMLTCFIRHFFLEFTGGQLSYHSHSENGNLTYRSIFCCSVIAFVLGTNTVEGGGGKEIIS